MRTITIKFPSVCAKCGKEKSIGEQALYERHVGIFCIECSPNTDEIREHKQSYADKKASKYEEWATKRQDKAGQVLASHERFTSDIAFNTQPGHIPFRARLIAQDNKARESLNIARQFEEKAESLRNGVRVKGDAEKERQTKRDAIKPLLKKGMTIFTTMYGIGAVEKINQKTVLINTGRFKITVDISWVKIVA